MPRQKGRWAKIETNFILRDERLGQVCEADRWIYLVLWSMCVDRGVTTLPPLACTNSYLSNQAQSTSQRITAAKLALGDKGAGLIQVESSGGITVCGVSRLHPETVPKRQVAHGSNDSVSVSGSYREKEVPSVLPKSAVAAVPLKFKKGVKAWENAIGRLVTKGELPLLQGLILNHGEERVIFAVGEAVVHSAVSLAYVKAVLSGSAKKAGDEFSEPGSLTAAAKKYLHPGEEWKDELVNR